MITLDYCRVKSIKADMVSNTVTIQFEHTLDDQVMDAKRELGILAYEKLPVLISVREQQPQLFKVNEPQSLDLLSTKEE